MTLHVSNCQKSHTMSPKYEWKLTLVKKVISSQLEKQNNDF